MNLPGPRLPTPPSGDWGLEVQNYETLDWNTLRPVPGGLLCERIFGPLHDWECACGELKGQEHAGETCPTCGVDIAASEVRGRRYGHIDLFRPVCQLCGFLGSPSPLSEQLGLPDETVRNLVYLERVIDPESGRLVPTAEARPGMLAGAEAIGWLLERAGVEASGFIARRIPVIPAGLREAEVLPGGKVRLHHVNQHYQRVINRNFRLRKLSELNAPFPILASEQQRLQQTVDVLTDNSRAPFPARDQHDRLMHSLADLLPAK